VALRPGHAKAGSGPQRLARGDTPFVWPAQDGLLKPLPHDPWLDDAGVNPGGDAMAGEPTEGMILLDVTEGTGEFDRDILERLGHQVVLCHGPEQATVCPLLAGDGCDGFAHAHGVVFQLDLDEPQHRAIVTRYRELAREDVPIRVVATAEQAILYGDELRGIEILTHLPTVADLDGFAAEVEAGDRT